MKKLFLLAIAATCFAAGAQAQKRDSITTRSLVNTDTLALKFTAVQGEVESLQITAVVQSGTLTGTNKVILKVSNDNVGWPSLDSLVMDNTKTINTKTFVLPAGVGYHNYQAYFITQGTITLKPIFSIRRRQTVN